MALINCPDCKKQISDAAPACPHCGRPGRQAVTVEQTGKGLKVFYALFATLFFIGLIAMMFTFIYAENSDFDPTRAAVMWFLLILVGTRQFITAVYAHKAF